MGEYDYLIQLVLPSFWWVYVSGIFILFEISRFVKKMWKDWVIRLEPDGEGGYRFISESFVPPTMKEYKPVREESHTLEPDLASPIKRGGRAVYFIDRLKTRPIVVKFKELQHGSTAKNGDFVGNPDADDWDEFATKKGFFQLLKANATQNPSIVLILVIGVMALVAGIAVGPYVLPHSQTCPLGWQCTPITGGNASTVVTSTANGAITHTIINGGTNTVSP